jgi:hypothetical protein
LTELDVLRLEITRRKSAKSPCVKSAVLNSAINGKWRGRGEEVYLPSLWDEVQAKKVHPTKFSLCDICGAEFNNKCKLERHRSLHTGEKRFARSVCGMQFNSKEE